MPGIFDRKQEHRAPRFYRWRHELTPYAIELRISLVPRLLAALRAEDERGGEFCGVLVGTFPTAQLPVLRIMDFVPVSATSADALQDQFRSACLRAETAESFAIGMVRSQTRSGPLALSGADRRLLEAEFRRTTHIALIVRPGEPVPTAGFLVSLNGVIQAEPTAFEFPFDAEELAQLSAAYHAYQSGPLPRVKVKRPGQPQPQPQQPRHETPSPASRLQAPVRTVLVALGVACAVLFGALLRPLLPAALEQFLPSAPPQLNLSTSGNASTVRIAWNHSVPDLRRAHGGRLNLSEGSSRRSIPLSMEDLRYGAVIVERTSPRIDISMEVFLSGHSVLVDRASHSL